MKDWLMREIIRGRGLDLIWTGNLKDEFGGSGWGLNADIAEEKVMVH